MGATWRGDSDGRRVVALASRRFRLVSVDAAGRMMTACDGSLGVGGRCSRQRASLTALSGGHGHSLEDRTWGIVWQKN